ncbi:MAG TPA: glucoamylase family protein [Kofleriaceae bacterium]|nr:glucoamylase family protein [Kofleriaceae bacterium]
MCLALAACGGRAAPTGPAISAADTAMIDDVEHRTFTYFWNTADPTTGLIPDRAPTPAFSSIAAVGFGLTAYAIGAERGYVTRAQARDRALTVLRFFRDAPQGEAATGVTGYKGFYYHFLDLRSGLRYRDVELSSVDTALLLAGALFCREYFAAADPAEAELRQIVDTLLDRVDWAWMQPRAPAIAMGWQPEHGFLAYDWIGYDEGMIVILLALGAASHPVAPAAWDAWSAQYDRTWGTAYGQTFLGFPPLFGHQYSHLWVDFRGIRDRYMRAHGLDYFENSRRATYAHQAYAIANPARWVGYDARVWGLTACDGPGDLTIRVAGTPRTIRGYTARGLASQDDGTIAPTAMISSLPFAPEIVVPGMHALLDRYGAQIYRDDGFADAFNPSIPPGTPVAGGAIEGSAGWVDTDALGIDQGPIVGMIENYRSDLVWKTMRHSAYLKRALGRAGFTGGWLEAAR